MATYAQIQDYVKKHYGFSAQTCWIAHVKSDLGLTERTAPNRQNPNMRVKPCPPAKRSAIIAALKALKVI
jgi:hypothetical protein